MSDYHTTATFITDAAMKEKSAKWHEIPGVAHGYTDPLLHPDWAALWQECVDAGATYNQKLGIDLADNSCCVDFRNGFYFMRRNKRGEISVEG